MNKIFSYLRLHAGPAFLALLGAGFGLGVGFIAGIVAGVASLLFYMP